MERIISTPFLAGFHPKNVGYIVLIAQQCRVNYLAQVNLSLCEACIPAGICMAAKTSRSLTKGVGAAAVDLGLNLGPALIWKSCMCSFPSILLYSPPPPPSPRSPPPDPPVPLCACRLSGHPGVSGCWLCWRRYEGRGWL